MPNASDRIVAWAAMVTLVAGGLAAEAGAWQPAEAPLTTRWAKDVTPESVLAEYPRPQMVRERWLNLNGLWDYTITPRDAAVPAGVDGQILVPFPIESALSGVSRPLTPEQWLWYRRSFELPAAWAGERIVLNFEAVDWEAVVYVNGNRVGEHRGGYDPFSFDITDALQGDGPQQITLRVWDPTGTNGAPKGKQTLEPGGITYTAASGIWQTVWLEPVAATHIERVRLVPDVERDQLVIEPHTTGDGGNLQLRAIVREGDRAIAEATGAAGKPLAVSLEAPKLWSPDSPFLYDLELSLLRDGEVIDHIESYFGMRSVGLVRGDDGVQRLALNGEPLFQFGPLNQDYWPDGIYTQPTDEALRFDVETVKRYGGNMMRVHTKVGARRLYYWADRLGVVVWQDMPHGDNPPEMREQFRLELRRMIRTLENHPSIVMWVPFNEGWGQFDTAEIVAFVHELDDTRLINNASGWHDRGVGDVHDVHVYPGPGTAPIESDRAVVLGEFGGLGLPVPGHMWQSENWGYANYRDASALNDAYENLLVDTWVLKGKGLAAAVYTQLTDVEVETNGWLTYDRAVEKIDPDRGRAAAERLYGPAPQIQVLAATADTEPQTWRYTTEKPAGDWTAPDYRDDEWNRGASSFGTHQTPNAKVQTVWDTSDIWLRRTFDLPDLDAEDGEILLSIYHDEDAEVYLNGELISRTTGYTTNYRLIRPDVDLGERLKPRGNVLAVHCRQTTGGQNIDVGLVRLAPAE